MLFLVVLYFIKLQTLPNNILEGNPLISVYLTPKILRLYAGLYSLLMAAFSLFLFPYLYSNTFNCSTKISGMMRINTYGNILLICLFLGCQMRINQFGFGVDITQKVS